MGVASGHQCRQLESKALAAARGEDGQQGVAADGRFHRLLLHGNAVEGAELVVAEKLLQATVRVKVPMAIVTTPARCVAQQVHHIDHLGKIAYHPGWSNRKNVVGTNHGQAVCQFQRVAHGQCAEVGMATHLAMIFLQDELAQVWPERRMAGGKADVFEESFKLGGVVKQDVIDFLSDGRQLVPGGNLVVQQVAGFHRVVHGVVQLVNLKLVVFHQMVIRAPGEQKGREKQCIDNRGPTAQGDVFQVMLDDVVTTHRVAH